MNNTKNIIYCIDSKFRLVITEILVARRVKHLISVDNNNDEIYVSIPLSKSCRFEYDLRRLGVNYEYK